jgi:hypothetical protein
MAILLEGTAQTNSNPASSRTVTITTTGTNRRIFVHALCNGGPVASVTSANLTFTRWGRSDSGATTVEIWYADAPTALTSEVITVTQTSSGYITVCATAAYSDAGLTIEFDADASNPTAGTSNTSGTISTATADTKIIGLYRSGSSATTTTAATWTGIDSNQFIMVEHKDFTSTQSSLSVPVMTNTSTNGWVIYAIKEVSNDATGTMAVTDAADVMVASGLETITGTMAVTDAADVMAASGETTPVVTGTMTPTEADDTMDAAGSELITGTMTPTEADDTMDASGTSVIVISGTIAVTDAADVMAASGVEIITGSATPTEAADSMVASGVLNITGTMAVSDAADSMEASGVLNITGAMAVTDTGDAMASEGLSIINIVGSGAMSDAADSMVAAGLLLITGTMGATEAADIMYATDSEIEEIIVRLNLTGYTFNQHLLTGKIHSRPSLTGYKS